MSWSVERTDSFIRSLKEHKRNAELLRALGNKFERLQHDPKAVGGKLSGELHTWRSTRLIRKFRLLFKIDETKQIVYLGGY